MRRGLRGILVIALLAGFSLGCGGGGPANAVVNTTQVPVPKTEGGKPAK